MMVCPCTVEQNRSARAANVDAERSGSAGAESAKIGYHGLSTNPDAAELKAL